MLPLTIPQRAALEDICSWMAWNDLVDLTTLIAKQPVPVANMQDAITVVALFEQTISQFLNRRRVKA